ncbi:MAG: hypothetical protein AAFN74_04720 [Myxococcota bacterium]
MLVAINLTGQQQRTACPKPLGKIHDIVAGMSGRLDGDDIVLDPYQVLFADLVVAEPA